MSESASELAASRGSASVDVGTHLGGYLMRAEGQEKRERITVQYCEARDEQTITCGCGLKRALILAYRCLYCGEWYCANCAEKHFGQTMQEWIIKKRIERRQEAESRMQNEKLRDGGQR